MSIAGYFLTPLHLDFGPKLNEPKISLLMNVHMYQIFLDKIWFWCMTNCKFLNLNWCNAAIALATLLGPTSFLSGSVIIYRRHFLSITAERFQTIFLNTHCVKSIRIRSYSGLYIPAFGLNTDRNSSEYRHFLRSGS